MKKYLIKENGKFYKTNMHCHTTISDGELTPEQVKDVYKKNGYSAVAFTDHDVFVNHNDLTDENFIALNGYEMEVDLNSQCDKSYHRVKSCHMCLVAKSPDITKQVCFHRTKYLHCSKPEILSKLKLNYDKNLPDYERTYNPECISDMMKTGRENGFFVTYNHPTWSGESYLDYINYNGMHAMEIYNNECVNLGIEEYNSRVYDNMLRSGKQLYCIASDDMHYIKSVGGGYIMVKADKLDYCSLTNALFDGQFYASTGAEIKELYIEDEYLYVTTSPSKMIALSCDFMLVKKVSSLDEPITSAKFKLEKFYKYIRIIVTDTNGKKAYTNAYEL